MRLPQRPGEGAGRDRAVPRKLKEQQAGNGDARQDTSLEDAEAMLARGLQLQRKFRESASRLRSHLEGDSRFEIAKQQVANWQQDVKLLAQHIGAQLRFCQSLREGKTLAKLLRGSPELEESRQSQLFLLQLKADIRGLQALHSTCKESFQLPDSAEGVMESFRLHPVSSIAVKGSTAEQEAADLEAWLSQFPVFRNQGDNSADAATAQPATARSIQELVAYHQRLLCSVFASLLQEKAELDATLGLKTDGGPDDNNMLALVPGTEAAAEAGGEGHPNSATGGPAMDETSELFRNVSAVSKCVVHLLGLSKTLGYMRDGVQVVDELHALRNENAELKARKKKAEVEAELLDSALASIKTETQGLDKRKAQSSKYLVRMEEARQRVLHIEEDYAALQRRNSQLVLENGQLSDSVARLDNQLRRQEELFTVEAAWFRPRLETMERMVLATATTFDAMAMDVELLTNMYLSACETLKKRDNKVSTLEREVDQISSKFRKLIKLMQEVKTENLRKDKVITALMGTRHEMAKTVKEAQARELRAEELRATAAKMLAQRDLELAELSAERNRLREAMQKAESAHLEAFEEARKLEQEKRRLASENSEEIQALRDEIQTLKTAGMDKATREAYDEMQLRLKHAVAAYQNLEERVAAQLR